MKKILILLLLFLIVGCHYSPNRRINNRKPPVIVIAIDPESSSIVLRDGDNKVFTIYETATTNAISKSLVEGDTVRINDSIKKITTSGYF